MLRILEPVANRTIDANMKEPDQPDLYAKHPAKAKSNAGQRQGNSRRVGRIVDDCTDPRAGQIAHHGKIRRQKKERQHPPLKTKIGVEGKRRCGDGNALKLERMLDASGLACGGKVSICSVVIGISLIKN